MFFGALAQATDDFGSWFKAQLADVHGMDIENPPPMPVIDYESNA